MTTSPHRFDADVLIIGSGFGGAVAALRYAEAGYRVIVLERGRQVTRENNEADADLLWQPEKGLYGFNEFRKRGKHVVPWLGVGVGGGSHAYAGTLKRRVGFDDFPLPIRLEEIEPYYKRAETVMDVVTYPDYPPYSEVRLTQFVYKVAEKLKKLAPNLVEDWGPVPSGISFAPPGGKPGTEFVNKHGARQRYADPSEQALLGGEIGSKNSLDYNYLFLAKREGAIIYELHEADRIEPLVGGGYRVQFTRYILSNAEGRNPGEEVEKNVKGSLTARRVVLAAGTIGSPRLLLRNRDIFRTLPDLSPRLGHNYTSNGDFVNFLLINPIVLVGWLGVLVFLVGLFVNWWLLLPASILYVLALTFSKSGYDPDIGSTNSDYIRFRHRDGSSQGAYIEGGRYPTPLRLVSAIIMSITGRWHPHRYRAIIRVTERLRRWVPPFELAARSWPFALLEMGRDDAVGRIYLDEDGEAAIDFPFDDNKAYYDYLDRIGRLVAKVSGAWYLPNIVARLFKLIEVPHNLGGCPMGPNITTGVVDDCGRVYGYANLQVLDGSIIPVAIGPNPALTILAFAERGVEKVIREEKEAEEKWQI